MNITDKSIREEAWEEFNNTPSNPVTIENPNPNQCKYPLGEELARAELFCGRKSHGKYSYCAYHLYLTTKQD